MTVADQHLLLQICAEHIRELPADPRPVGKRDAYAVQATTHTLIARAYRALGVWPFRARPKAGKGRDPKRPSVLPKFERPQA